MELCIVPFSEVEEALAEAKAGAIGGAHRTQNHKFNRSFYSHYGISKVIPETDTLKHVKPSLYPSFYRHWIELITTGQGAQEWHAFDLPTHLTADLALGYRTYNCRGKISRTWRGELAEEFPKATLAGTKTEEVFDGREWFLRFDAYSTKDSKHGVQPIKTVEDVIDQLYTSERAWSSMFRDLRDDPSVKSRIYLVPFNRHMNPAWEFRVFCPPPKCEISAISQYRWHAPLAARGRKDAGIIAAQVYHGSLDIHRQIMESKPADESVIETMKREGFTFDVLYIPSDSQVQLIEINPFGAMSGCGSCLYHWLADAPLLYGFIEKIAVIVTF